MMKGKMGIFNKNASDVVNNLGGLAIQSTSDLLKSLKYYSINIFSESILGFELSDEKFGLKVAKYFDALDRAMTKTVSRMVRPWLYSKMLLPLFPDGREHLKLREEVRNFTTEILLEIKNSVTADGMSDGEVRDCDAESRKSFVRILLEQHLKDPSFTLKDIEDHMAFFAIAGHDTTSTTLMWLLYLLGHHPEVQERAISEIEMLTGSDVAYDDLNQLEYLDCIIKETLRLYPVVPIIGRRLTKDIECANYKIPKGTDVIYFLYMYHRNPDTYPNPEKFDPDRFYKNSDIRPWMHLAFSEGIRYCLGKKFAMMGMKIFLVHFFRRFQVKTLDILDETDLDWKIILNTTKRARMVLTLRRQQTHRE